MNKGEMRKDTPTIDEHIILLFTHTHTHTYTNTHTHSNTIQLLPKEITALDTRSIIENYYDNKCAPTED